MSIRTKNLKGKIFGRLVALKYLGPYTRSSWVCRCECGRQTIVRGHALQSGLTRSCGCFAKHLQTRRFFHGHAKRNTKAPDAKTFIYAWLLGAGVGKVSEIKMTNTSSSPASEQLYRRMITADRIWYEPVASPAQNPVMPAKLTGELACIIECCDPPEHQTDEAVERLIFDYQPMWDRLRAALVPLQERGGK